MAPSKSRQRALARAKLERQIARRAVAARRRRQWQAGIGGALVLALVVLGGIWLAGGFKPAPKAPADCAWTSDDASANSNLKDVGLPPTRGIQHAGSKVMTITTNQGVISALLDAGRAPCTVASFNYLASKNFFDNTKCHRLTTSGIFVLQCGDPSGTGQGGPSYHFPNEYVPSPSASASDQASASASAPPSASPSAAASASASPATPTAVYPRGTVAMAHSSQPDSNGSQFFIVYKDSPLPADYTIFGTVTSGLEVVDKIAAGGVDAAASGGSGSATDGTPKIQATIQSLTVSDTAPSTPASSAAPRAPAPTPAPSPTASASGTP